MWLLRSAPSLLRLLTVAVWLAGVLMALSASRAHGQVRSSLGGDLSGPPSNASVDRVRGQVYNPSGASAGDIMMFDGSEWNKYTPSWSSGGGTDYPLLQSSLSSTTSVAWPTSAVTFTSILIPSANVTTPFKLKWNFGATSNVTSGVPNINWRYYIGGKLGTLQTSTFTSSAPYIQMEFDLRWLRGGGAGSSAYIYSYGQSNHNTHFPIVNSGTHVGTLIAPGPPDNVDVLFEVTMQSSGGSPVIFFSPIYQDLIIYK